MKLTAKNIAFIDNYLHNSDIVYEDVRMEMVDHVASDIEAIISEGDQREFYYIFKDYMIEHKSRLLNSNKQFIRSADNKLIKLIFCELIKWPVVLFFIVLLIVFDYVNVTSEISIVKSWFGLIPLTAFTFLGIVYFIALRHYKLNRFSSIERLGFIFAMSFQLFHFCWNISHLKFMVDFQYIVIGLVSLTLSILLAMVLVTGKQMKYYQAKYKSLV